MSHVGAQPAERPASASILVPTFERHEVLLGTIRSLLAQERKPDEIVIVDQTPRHPEAVESELGALEAEGSIRRLRRERPSIPGAMNDALLAARCDLAIFVDDDVEPAPGFVESHLAAHRRWPDSIVAGQVLQPGEEPADASDGRFSFRSTDPQSTLEFMGGNFSAPRELLLRLGGFDEAFVAVAYRFERELADRAAAAGCEIRYEPAASLRHLRAARGGTRAFGDHLRTALPTHSVGEYYYLLRNRRRRGRWRAILARPWTAVRTRHHLKRPWWIPVTLVAELSGFIWALALASRGPRLLPVRRGAR